MTPTRALIEAAEELVNYIRPLGQCEARIFDNLRTAISSAKAAEEEVEMDKDEAIAKAKAIWGDKGSVRDATRHGMDCFQVGLTYKNGIWVIGWGRTWSQAFENALTKPNPMPPTFIEVREKEGV